MSSTIEFISQWIRQHCTVDQPVDAESVRVLFTRKVTELVESGSLSPTDEQANAYVLLDSITSYTAGQSLQKWSGIRRVKYLNWSRVAEHINKPLARKPQGKYKKMYVARNAEGVSTRFGTLKDAIAVGFHRDGILASVKAGGSHKNLWWSYEQVRVEDAVSV